MKIYAAALAAALISTGALAQVAGQAQYYGKDWEPAGSSMTYGNSTPYYGRDGAPAGSVTYSRMITAPEDSQSIIERTTSQSTRDTQQLFRDNGMGQQYRR